MFVSYQFCRSTSVDPEGYIIAYDYVSEIHPSDYVYASSIWFVPGTWES